MVNTLPYLAEMPAQILIALMILFSFIAKATPGLKKASPSWIFVFVLVICFVIEAFGEGSQSIFFGMMKVDSFGRMFNQIYFLTLIATLLMMAYSKEMEKEKEWEIVGLFATICLGMMLMSSATNLLMTVIAIELVSLPSYVLVAMNRLNSASKEASLKYVLFGSFATGIMLYGMSLLFGLTGALEYETLWRGLALGEIVNSPVFLLAILMTLGGFTFKISAVPFHYWCPDAYQAAPTPVTAFLSVAPKIAGVALILRFFSDQISSQTELLTQIIAVIAMATMTLGNLAALRQKDIKRLLAYSSISHAGFLLMGVTVMNQAGKEAIFFYTPIYLLMNLGAFMAIILLSDGKDFRINAFRGAITKTPLLVVSFSVCIFSLAGLPPFAGFIGKFYLFKVVLEEQLFLLAVVAGLNSVVSLYFYVNILKVMIIDKEDRPERVYSTKKLPIAFVTICAIPLVFFGVYWQWLLDWTEMIDIF